MKELSDSDFDLFVKENAAVVVDFWAPWCGPCRVSTPIFEELSKEFSGKAHFVKVNVDDNPEIAGKFGIMSIPTFLIFKDGEQAGEIHGAYPKAEFKKMLAEHI